MYVATTRRDNFEPPGYPRVGRNGPGEDDEQAGVMEASLP